MSGSDLCEWATIEDVWNANAATYARDLGLAAGCGTTEQDLPTQYLVECLRGKSFDDIVNASASVYKRVCPFLLYNFSFKLFALVCFN